MIKLYIYITLLISLLSTNISQIERAWETISLHILLYYNNLYTFKRYYILIYTLHI